jgi:DNA-binding NtrC family response regulator
METAESTAEAQQAIAHTAFDLVLSDYRLPDASGLELLEFIKKTNPTIHVVIMTAFENARHAVSILQLGGDDYLIKPTEKKDIEHLLIRSFEQCSFEHENQVVHETVAAHFDSLPLVYKSPEMQTILNTISRTADSDATVLVTGESGTGKELIANLIHSISTRRTKPFVTVNIAALPESLMESELFGHIKGAFTGAEQKREGRFEQADGGTLFIDEIGDIPPSIQVKLLRVLQFGQIQRIGENTTRGLDVRIIAATNRNLKHMVEIDEFRSDLFWRINVIPLHLPPLRERKTDIEVLVNHFIEKFNDKNQRSISGVSREALSAIMQHSFPGNIRELENIIERAALMARGSLITLHDLPLDTEPVSITAPEAHGDYELQMRRFEHDLLSQALEAAGGNQSEAARRLGISERRFRSRMEIVGLRSGDST